jgi:thiamine-phosphate pyrophosphorylase
MSYDKQIIHVLRIMDANLNRLSEGLRVMEEFARLILNNQSITTRLKTIRHHAIRGDLAFNRDLLNARDAVEDIGINLEVAGESKTRDITSLLVANSRRVQESLRVLEELSKLPGIKLDSDKFKEARFSSYTIEKEIMAGLLRQEKISRLKGLYVVVDTANLNNRSHVEITRMAINGGAAVVQLRDKLSDKISLLAIARDLRDLCTAGNVLFIVNDYIDIALATGADGVHLGQHDMPVVIARKQIPINMILGCSATTLEETRQAEKDGADYIGFGAVFPTGTKSDAVVTGIELLKQAVNSVRIPVVAIGGINKDNIKDVLETGAFSAAVISAVLQADNPEYATRELAGIMNHG